MLLKWASNNKETLEALLNTPDRQNNVPIHVAAREGNDKMVKVLTLTFYPVSKTCSKFMTST